MADNSSHHSQVIPLLILIARPAAGKSEIIAYLNKLPYEERLRRFHIGEIHRIDDFPMLWSWFEEDRLLEEMGKPRLHTDHNGFFTHRYLWDLLIRRLSLEFQKAMRDFDKHEDREHTVIIEFSRGSEHGGFRRAFEHLSDEILSSCAVLYIDVSYEESRRKNLKRFNPDRPDSILEHGLPEDKMEKLYGESDWPQLLDESGSVDPSRQENRTHGYIHINDYRIPFAVFENEDDVTTAGGEALADRLAFSIDLLKQAVSADQH